MYGQLFFIFRSAAKNHLLVVIWLSSCLKSVVKIGNTNLNSMMKWSLIFYLK
ncbi:hypothetical protein RV18_GL000816 [Enterococcus termitis]|nr:hypothetical protein RV18_GL000816 [Enterococcus termitis]